jgi:two-component system chemotaxis sensor kinase CheA
MFLSEAREHLSGMNRLLVALEKSPQDKGSIDSLFRSAHSIKGMAASMGYEGIAELSHKMEDMMDRFRKGEMTITPEAIDMLLEGMDDLGRLVDAVEQERAADVDVSEIIERIKGFGKEVTPPGREAAAPQVPDVKVPQVPAGYKAAPARGFNISIGISPDSSAPAVRAFLIIRKMKEIGEIISTKPSEDDIRGGRFSGTLSLGVRTGMEKDGIEAVIREMGEVSSVTLEPLVPQIEAKPEAVPQPEPAGVPLPPVVKVSISLLDYFVNAVGELIINKSRLHEISKTIPSKEMKEGLNQLDRLVRDLQNQVMSVRMMPIGTVTERFPRVIRDLARKQGKEVEFSIKGEDIELDRSILEGLGNPLTHIIRNCIDHGIEPPDERRALGKPLPAVVRINAAREKDQVFMEVSDDGRGMDPERLKESAVKKGLITAEQASGMGEKEALLLTCIPGFSTAKEVSEVSGRGVGMDAVKSGIEAMGGSVDIDSIPGRGTRVTLKLPLTVAIIHSLLVEAASEVFAIPISRVMKTIEVEKGDVKVSQKQRLIDFNGSLMPLLSLWKILRLQPGTIQEGFIPVVVTEIKGRTVGLVVDRFLGQQETFIKPLGRPLNRIAGLSGTTVLGNGRTIFLLDVGNLI